MAGRSFNRDFDNSPENSAGSGDSPRSADAKAASTSSSRRSRRAIQKRVVSVPLKDVEGFRLKGDPMSAPPSDSWAWRKYGQKPIKGSPYPRGYYRCSSSKGCPARKQVERSRDDPKMLVVTYSCEHNHPWPASRNRGSGGGAAAATLPANSVSEEEEEEFDEKPQLENHQEDDQKKKKSIVTNPVVMNSNNQSQEAIPDYKFMETNEFGIGSWMSDFDCTTTMLESAPILADHRNIDVEMDMIFTMGEEDDSLFADLGELPECSTVFRRGMVEREAAHRRPPGLAATTS